MIKLFDGVRDHAFADGVCFLCGTKMPVDAYTVEHVIPKWLQRKFALWDVRVHLLNGTQIPYRDLVIPCCSDCNNIHLSKIERQVRERVEAGPSEVMGMDRVVLSQWLLKIFFGFLYREIFLPLDRTRPGLGSIVAPADMEQFQFLHYILQSVRVPMEFDFFGSPVPASIFVFEVKEPSESYLQFDYKDDVIHRCVQLRMGRIGVLAAFDMGFQAVEGAEFFPKYFGHALHPLQFNELAVNLFSKGRKLEINPTLIFSESPAGISIAVVPPGRSPFAPLKTCEQGEMLAHFTGLPLDVVLPSPDRRITFLQTEDGAFRDIPIHTASDDLGC